MSSPIRRWYTAGALLLSVLFFLLPGHLWAQESSDAPRKVVARIAPQYPTLARTMNIRGNVKVEVLVTPNGTVKSVAIKGGHPMLADAAQNAIRQWKWEPNSHATTELVEIRFQPQ